MYRERDLEEEEEEERKRALKKEGAWDLEISFTGPRSRESAISNFYFTVSLSLSLVSSSFSLQKKREFWIARTEEVEIEIDRSLMASAERSSLSFYDSSTIFLSYLNKLIFIYYLFIYLKPIFN